MTTAFSDSDIWSDDSNAAELRAQKNRNLQEFTTRHYDQLPTKRGSIRLLKLSSGIAEDREIQGKLITKVLSEDNKSRWNKTKYEALSWCWGREDFTDHIVLTKGDQRYLKRIKPNLGAALRELRHRNRPRYLWIDAICIDQEHVEERNHQVDMMSEIYGGAKGVCIWLGEATDESRTAIPFIKNEILKLQNFDRVVNDQQSGRKWLALLKVMQCEWFSRRWVSYLFCLIWKLAA